MKNKRLLSLIMVFVMLFTSMSSMTYAVESSNNTIEIRGLDGNWDQGAYSLNQVEPYIWQNTFTLNGDVSQAYKGHDQSDWLSYRTNENKSIAIDSTQDVIFTYYEQLNMLIDSINYPNGIEAKIVGSQDALGQWDPLLSPTTMQFINGSKNILKATISLASEETVEYKIIFNPAPGFEWSESLTGGNIVLTNPLQEDLSVDVYLNLSNKDLFTSLDLKTPEANVTDGDSLESSDSIIISGSAATLRYEMTSDGSDPSAVTSTSSIFPGVTLSDYEGEDLKFNFLYEKYGVLSEPLSLAVHVNAPVVDTLFISSTTPLTNATEVETTDVSFTFNKVIQSIDVSKISVTPSVGFNADFTDQVLTVTLPTLELYTDYSLTLDDGAVSSSTLSSDHYVLNFKSALKSPIINGKRVQFNAVHDGGTLNLVGSPNGWDNTGIAMTKNNSGYFTLTLDLLPGNYQYKYFPVSGSWDNGFTDQLNSLEADGNSAFWVDGLKFKSNKTIEQGNSVTLSTEYFMDGQSSDVVSTYTLKDNYSGIDLVGDQLTAQVGSVLDDIVVVANYSDHQVEMTFEVVEKMNTFIVNYYKYDGNYSGYDLWYWYDGENGQAIGYNQGLQNDFMQMSLQTTNDHINILPRKSDWSYQESDIHINGTDVTEVWIIEGDSTVYTSRNQVDINKKVLQANFDENSNINVMLTHPVTDEEVSSFKLYDGDQVVASTVSKTADNKITLHVEDLSTIDVRKIYTVRSDSFNAESVSMRRVLDDTKYLYTSNDLGVTYSNTSSTFKVWAPTATAVSVATYNTAGTYVDGVVTDYTGGTENLMTRADNGVWTSTLSGDLNNQYYMYKVEFADGTVNYAIDPYVKATSANGQRGAIIDFSVASPTHWTEEKPFFVDESDMVLYELHVRDFSIDSESNATNKGKYKAFTETGTTYNGQSTGIDHIQELGVTHVHLLPVYDFKTVDELVVDDATSSKPKFNWGYDPQNYNVPEGSYSSDPTDPYARIVEFKEMVQAMHDADLRVVMDVVYNHTFSVDEGPFNKIVPGYFYRTDDRGSFTNGSGCGNEVATERPMVRKYIKDSVKYWATEYNVDGFRFDLMGLIDLQTMEELTYELKHEIDDSIIVYGEPWTAGSNEIYNGISTVKGTQKDKDFAVFNDNIRSAIKGGSDGDSKGFATGKLDALGDVVTGLYGGTDFTNSPTESITYVTAHDNLVLWDKVLKTQHIDAADPYATLTETNIFDNETVQRSILANGMVLTSQGIPFIHAGSEILRSKQGDHNSYKSDDTINKINWENKVSYEPVFDYYQGLIELRKAHPAFTMETHDEISTNMITYKQDDGVIAYKLVNYANNDTWDNIVVIYNGNTDNKTVDLPSDTEWHVVVDNDEAGNDVINTFTGNQVSVSSLSMMILYDNKKADYIPVATEIITSKDVYNLEPTDSVNMSPYVVDQEGNRMIGESISYEISDTTVVGVLDGTVSALKEGAAVVTLQSGLLTKTVTIQVEDSVLTRIEIVGDLDVYISKTTHLTTECFDQNDSLLLGELINWSSSDESIATVSNGTVTGIAPGTVEITASVGLITNTFTLEVKAYEARTVKLYYYRDDETYDNWDLWLWDTGETNDAIAPIGVTELNGKNYLEFEFLVSPDSLRVGSIIRKNDWSEKDPDYDRFIDVPSGVEFMKVFSYSGVGEFTYVKVLTGPEIENGNATIYYRDDVLFSNNDMDSIDGVKLVFDDQEYDMTYDDVNALYRHDEMNLSEGDHLYYFLVTINGVETKVLDTKNEQQKDGASVLTYLVPQITVTASFSKETVGINEGVVLSIETTSNMPVEIKDVYVDLTEINGQNHVSIDQNVKAITMIPTTSGTKQVVVTVVDVYGNTHTGMVSLQVSDEVTDSNWDEAVIYFMVTDRFNDGDLTNNMDVDKSHLEAYHGGDFQGIIDKLDYLETLGINTIWITPIVDNIDFNQGKAFDGTQYGYHGYWAKDFTSLDEHLGDIETFKSLIDQAHDKGIKIMVDVVVNHTGYGMNEASTLNTDKLPTLEERAVFDDMIRETSGSDALTQYLAGLPDFETEDAAVRNQLILWQTDWLNRAKTDRGDTIDYFRVDTVKHVEHATWQALKNELVKQDANFKMIGEYYDGSLSNTGDYLGSDQMDSILDFNFKWKAKLFVEGQLELIEQELNERNTQINENVTLGQFLSSHDEDGFLTRFNVSDDKLTEYAMLAASLQMTSKGQVVVYYGEEIGLKGKNATDMAAGQYSENRYDMIFDTEDEDFNQQIFNHYTKMLNIRKDYSEVFAKGNRKTIYVSDTDQVTIFERKHEKSLLIGLNTGQEAFEKTITTDYAVGTQLIDLYSSNTYLVEAEGHVTITLPKASEGGTVVLTIDQVQPDMIQSIENVSDLTVKYNTREALAISGLPMTTTITTYSGNTYVVGLDWTISHYNKHVSGQYTAVGTFELPVEVLQTDPTTRLNIEATVVVQASKSNSGNNSSPGPSVSISLDKTRIELEVGTEADDKMTSYDLTEKVSGTTNKAVTWTSSNPEIASVDENGVVTPHKVGETLITVKTQDMNRKALCTVVVYMVGEEVTPQAGVSVSKAYIGGYPDGEFKPEKSITRAEVASIFAKLLSSEDYQNQAAFNDLETSHWAYDDIKKVVSLGLFGGYEDDTFRANQPIKRAEIAIVFSNYWKLTKVNKASTPVDVKDVMEHWAGKAIYQLYNAEIVSGFEDGTFRPDADTKRGEFVVMMNKLINRKSKETDKTSYKDVKGHWAKKYIEAASETMIE